MQQRPPNDGTPAQPIAHPSPPAAAKATPQGHRQVASAAASEGEDALPAPGEELLALLGMAHALGMKKALADRSISISTSMLFFALASSDTVPPLPQQPSSPAGLCFASVLKELAQERYQQVWDAYFHFPQSDFSWTGDFSDAGKLPLSTNARIWLQAAARYARQSQRQQVELADFIGAFWGLAQGRCLEKLQQMGVDIAMLHSQYEHNLLSGHIPEAPARKGAASPPSPTAQSNHIRQYLQHDRASHLDQMGFHRYAIAVAAFLTSGDTHGPISVSIQAPWGAGKSSLMRQIQFELEPAASPPVKQDSITTRRVLQFLNRQRSSAPPANINTGKRWTIWFNAWKYESSEQVWAGLVDAIVSQVSDRLPAAERELFLLRLNLSRIDDGLVRKKIYDRVATLWWVSIRRWALTAGALILSFGTVSALISHVIPERQDWSAASLFGAAGTQVAIAMYAVWAFFQSRKKIEDEPATFSLAEYMRVPDYAKSVGIMHHIHQDLQRVVETLPNRKMQDGSGTLVNEPLVIFIDDLDRCSPNKIASVIEGLNTFLAGDRSEFLFVIGMDPQVVAAALEHAHRDVKSHLPAYEQTVPLGWRYMDKFIQLAFTIPPGRDLKNDTFIDYLIGADTSAAPAAPDSQPGATAGPRHEAPADDPRANETAAYQRQREASRQFHSDGKDVQQIMRSISREYASSPREIKRTLNFVRFLLLLRISRTAHQRPTPALAQYQRWAVLCMRWPDLALWLQWGNANPPHAETSAAFDNMTAQRLSLLEQCTATTNGAWEEWGKRAADTLGLPIGKVSWLANPDIYQFFVQENRQPPAERISAGAAIGYY